MKRHIQTADNDYAIMLKQYKHHRKFKNRDDGELADLLDDLKNKGVPHDVYQDVNQGGCTVFYDNITAATSDDTEPDYCTTVGELIAALNKFPKNLALATKIDWRSFRQCNVQVDAVQGRYQKFVTVDSVDPY